VLGITAMLEEEQQEIALANFKTAADARFQQPEETAFVETSVPVRIHRFKRYMRYGVAALLLGAVAGLFIIRFSGKKTTVHPAALQVKPVPDQVQKIYATRYAEKKKIRLPDSSAVLLNAGSTLVLADDFGKTSRDIYLEGEAFFNVTHHKQVPFIVHMKNFDVKVLGTVFNVQAYPEDRTSEASLIGGKIEVVMKNKKAEGLVLQPNQKVVIYNNTGTIPDSMEPGKMDQKKIPQHTPVVRPLTSTDEGHSFIETAWTTGRLEINNKPFAEIKADLERLYNVHIYFKDDIVSGYRFSATFETENISQVLKALQLSYPFRYEMENNRIVISK
jgi:ferric-dicitrate binding protein FerR (iron transport regulator)